MGVPIGEVFLHVYYCNICGDQTFNKHNALFTLKAVSPTVTRDPRQQNHLPGRPISSKLLTLQADGH